MSKLETARKLLKIDLGCPPKCCFNCEEYGIVFLPQESEFLSKKCLIGKGDKKKFFNRHFYKGHQVYAILMRDGDCPFYKFSHCANREARSLDCMTHPAIPIFRNNKIDVRFDEKCSLVANKKIPKDFKKRVRRAWSLVDPPHWWKDFYNKVQVENFGKL